MCQTNDYDEEEDGKDLHIAPMLDVTTVDFRQLMRILSRRAILWTEMVVDETIVYTDPANLDFHLSFPIEQKPIVCQLGGNRPHLSKTATRILTTTTTTTNCGNEMEKKYDYDEINLNCECPSNRVCGKKSFGAALMKNSELACQMIQAIQSETSLKVSVKTRIGVDDWDDLPFLIQYIDSFVNVGCTKFYIHARKVYTHGLSPAQNRNIPPLNYHRVYQLCHTFPNCHFIINGGISTLYQAKQLVLPINNRKEEYGEGDDVTKQHGVPCDICKEPYGSCIAPPSSSDTPKNLVGVMLGRAAMNNPCMFWDVDRYFYNQPQNPCQNRRQVLHQYVTYLNNSYPRQCPFNCTVCQTNNNHCEKTTQTDNSSNTNKSVLDNNQKTSKKKQQKDEQLGIQIHSSTIDRALRPIMGIMHNLRGSKKFRRTLDQLSRDSTIRNCGPAYILQKAIEISIPDQILDQAFIKTEELEK